MNYSTKITAFTYHSSWKHVPVNKARILPSLNGLYNTAML